MPKSTQMTAGAFSVAAGSLRHPALSPTSDVPREFYGADPSRNRGDRTATYSHSKWKPTPELRYRKVNFGQPVLQQLWRDVSADSRTEWRDVPVVEV
jgi:hypothetical protein